MTSSSGLFPYQPPLAQTIAVGGGTIDIHQPWIDLASRCGETEFSAKALFVVGLMLRYVESANAVLSGMRYRGFLSAFELLASAIELLGRCVHQDASIRQNPKSESDKRLEAGMNFIKLQRLPAGVIVETNHFNVSSGGYSVEDLKALRNFATHGAAIDATGNLKADIELLHEIRKALLGVLAGESDPHCGQGPLPGAIDQFLELLMSGSRTDCDRLADAAINPEPLILHGGGWHFADQIVQETRQRVLTNQARGVPLASGSYTKEGDRFQLYP